MKKFLIAVLVLSLVAGQTFACNPVSAVAVTNYGYNQQQVAVVGVVHPVVQAVKVVRQTAVYVPQNVAVVNAYQQVQLQQVKQKVKTVTVTAPFVQVQVNKVVNAVGY